MLSELGFMGILRINPAIVGTMVVLSVLLLTFLLERAWYFLLYAGWSDAFWHQLKSIVQSGRLHEARAVCQQSKNVFARVFFTVISNTHLSRVDNEDLVQIEKENIQENLRKRLGLFATLSFISPLVGLLGTVLGIMHAFHDLGRSGSGGANIVAAGIAEALVTTASGILVAVPAAVLYNFFTYRLRSIVVRMNNYASELIIIIYGGEEAGAKIHQAVPGEIHAKTVR